MSSSGFALAAAETASLASQFTWIDWLVIVCYLALTTWIGTALAGKQATMRDFFLGGRKLPWWAVSGSTIATEISAVTFVGVPAIVYGMGPESNFKYLQLGLLGWAISRIVVGYVFVPAYYKREIYSPYDYMANELGGGARTVTTCLFILGGALAQGSRVYLTALILDLVIGKPAFGGLATATGTDTLVWSIYLIGIISITWTWIGGISTVIWTELILFCVFMFSALFALVAVIIALPGDFFEALRHMLALGYSAKESGPWGKFTFFDFDTHPARQYTVWTAIIASSWGGLNAFGTDQMMVQRLFCCRGPRQARWAIIASNASQLITLTMLMVGVGLFSFYYHYPLVGEAAELVAENSNRIFPVFIIQELPTGASGIVIAGIFAAAVSTLVSVVASFSQTTLSAFYLPWRRRRLRGRLLNAAEEAVEERKLVSVSRVLVVVWGLILCLMAQLAEGATQQFPAILDLALSMAGYTAGALLAGFLLAFLKLGIDSRGFLWSAPLSVFFIFALVWHQQWAHVICWIGAAVMLGAWLWHVYITQSSDEVNGRPVLPVGFQTVILVVGLALMLWINYYGYFGAVEDAQGNVKYIHVAWPWFAPIGSTVAFIWGYLLARKRPYQPGAQPLDASTIRPAATGESNS